MTGFESVVEEAAIEWLKDLGWDHAYGPDLAPDGKDADRANYGSVILQNRLYQAPRRINDH